MTKKIFIIAIAVMTSVLILAALWQFRIVLLYVLISLVMAATFRPISRGETTLAPRQQAVLLLRSLLALVIAGLAIFLVGWLVVGDVQQLSQSLSEQTEWQLPAWLESTPASQDIDKWLPAPDQLIEIISSQPVLILSAILGVTEGIGGVAGGLVVVVILSIYWSLNQSHFERLWLSLLPAEQRRRARFIWRTIEHDLGAYSRSEIIQSLLALLLLGLGYWFLGSPYAALLALTGALLRLIPVAGSLLALILPLLLGLLSGTQVGLSTTVYTIVVLTFLHAGVEPRLFRFKSDNPVLTFVILLAMADAFGLLGIIVAPPLSVICQILWRMLVSERLATESTIRVRDLQEQHAQLGKAMQEMEGPPPPLVVSSMERLAGLLEKAEPLLRTVQIDKPPDRLSPP
jgi:putative permease